MDALRLVEMSKLPIRECVSLFVLQARYPIGPKGGGPPAELGRQLHQDNPKGILGGKQFVHDYMWSRDEVNAYHPEMYDENGIMLNEELLTVKFINEEDEDETLDA